MSDRIGYIAVYFIGIALVVLVVELDLLGQHAGLGWDNLLYIAILSVVGVGVYLIVDYARNRPFHRQLARMADREAELDDVLGLQGAVTREQRAMQTIAIANYGKYVERLEQYKQQQDQHQTFVRQWVHQMKTPVSVINLLTQQAEGADREEAKSLAASMQEENEKLAHGLDMMLSTARLEKFELDLHIKQVELIRAVRSVINEHKKACIRYRIFPKIEANAEAIWAETDEKWLGFILNQLITNAIKYSKPKEGAKTLLVTVTEQDRLCRVAVQDEGIGIAQHDLPRIFQAFFTGENGRRVAESTGMGLYLAEQVCMRLGHRLEAVSTLGDGTEVTLTIAQQAGYHRVT
ncbi:sensor histidine kinase [Paenibacillus ginsengarvi]|uniref:histidine kinase n=1 Tax=Paenibacillus ginsengarvi TaxID=400777 RepID=A0A3B0CPL3_9BACL|nr:sensor histidine kinase [Paenibacillus ginsengarvi]